jgi:hypothetical protein
MANNITEILGGSFFGQNLSGTLRCKCFENISSDIWHKVIEAHNVGYDLDERGITDFVIVQLLNYYHSKIKNFGLYTQKGWKESENGGDIDVFVEVQPDKYVWFALQAKVLKLENQYPTDTIRHCNSSGEWQWDLLKNLEKNSGCKAYYLFYNGRKNADIKLLGDKCSRSFDISQFGCSLVEPEIVKKIANRTNGSRGYLSPSFEDFHPQYAQPWRILTCCKHDYSNSSVYSLVDILGALRNYEVLIPAQVPSDFVANTFQDNPISISSLRSGWKAAVTMISQLTSPKK